MDSSLCQAFKPQGREMVTNHQSGLCWGGHLSLLCSRAEPVGWAITLSCGHKLEAAWPAVACVPGVLLPKSPWEVALWTGTDWGHNNLWVYVKWRGAEGSVVKVSGENVCHSHTITSRAFSPSFGLLQNPKGEQHTPLEGVTGLEKGAKDRTDEASSENNCFAESIWRGWLGSRLLGTNTPHLEQGLPWSWSNWVFSHLIPKVWEQDWSWQTPENLWGGRESEHSGSWVCTSEPSWWAELCNKLEWNSWGATW